MLLCLFVVSTFAQVAETPAESGSAKITDWKCVFEETFDKGSVNWTTTDPDSWELTGLTDMEAFSGNNKRISNYTPRTPKPPQHRFVE
ncbi:MAG: hypothetical protein R3C03_21500 [Pirellulaceae bacterium]